MGIYCTGRTEGDVQGQDGGFRDPAAVESSSSLSLSFPAYHMKSLELLDCLKKTIISGAV